MGTIRGHSLLTDFEESVPEVVLLFRATRLLLSLGQLDVACTGPVNLGTSPRRHTTSFVFIVRRGIGVRRGRRDGLRAHCALRVGRVPISTLE